MIVVLINNISSASNVILSAHTLSESLGKQFGVILFSEKTSLPEARSHELNALLMKLNIQPDHVSVESGFPNQLHELCMSIDVSFLYIQLTNITFAAIKRYLRACRELRIPYLLYKDSFKAFTLKKVLVPVSFLIEEIEKAQFAAAFGRFCGAEVTLLQANDYGSKAAMNVAKINSVFDKFDFNYQVIKGLKDSFKIEYNALEYANENNYDIIIASASREYGLDDIVFGPKELHLIKKTKTPIMLINPRADLYTLCD